MSTLGKAVALVATLMSFAILGGCDKPACKQLRAAMCVQNIDNPAVPVLCEAGRSMARSSQNDHCAEVLSKLDLSVLHPK